MILKLEEFQSVVKTILLAVDGKKSNLELIVDTNVLKLNVTNKEYYVSAKFAVSDVEDFRATVDAKAFLDLVAGLTTETFELKVKDNTVIIKSGKSSYKLPMIYENDKLMSLPVISIENKTVEMPISLDILQSILNVNSKELIKAKALETVNELQKLYYITNEGCFTFTSGACLNRFTLEKPIKILLNDRIVKLFKLFKTNVKFSFGTDALSDGTLQTKVIFETDNTYLAAIITNDTKLLAKVEGPCIASKTYIDEKYPINAVVSTSTLNAALSRLMLFAKNSNVLSNALVNICAVTITSEDITFTDVQGNIESVIIENGGYVNEPYSFSLNIADVKLVLDSCKDEHITFNCGNQRSVVLVRGNISNLIPEEGR